MRLRIRDLKVALRSETILWKGEIGGAGFLVTVPPDAPLGTHAATASVHMGGMRITTLGFVVDVQTEDRAPAELPMSEKRVRRAFASYASADRDAVLARVQGIQKAAPEIDIFLDVARLRSGENWRDVLRSEIVAREVLFLFWSEAGRHSNWVDWEWRCALQHHGIRSIDPVPLVSPDRVPPPPELASELHFNDWVLAYLSK